MEQNPHVARIDLVPFLKSVSEALKGGKVFAVGDAANDDGLHHTTAWVFVKANWLRKHGLQNGAFEALMSGATMGNMTYSFSLLLPLDASVEEVWCFELMIGSVIALETIDTILVNTFTAYVST